MKVLYYDCFSGISGDMNIGALLDLGVSLDYLSQELDKLGLSEHYKLRVSRKTKMGIEGTKFDMDFVEKHPHHRGFSGIKAIIEVSSLAATVKHRAIEIFHHLAVAEAKVHGTTVDEVHFHEVGAIDAIVDIVGAAICLDYLKVDKIYSLPPEVGSGFVKCAHGTMPVPAPATANLLVGVPFSQRVQGEATTPTGAAILKTTVTAFTRPETLIVEKIGYGLGTKDFEQPNVLRVFLCTLEEENGELEKTTQYVLEANIDDMNPEFFAAVEDRLFAAGAVDVFRIPIYMKKGRLGVKLSVLYAASDEAKLLHVLFRETTTIGVRRITVDKLMLTRTSREISTPYGSLRVKQAFYNGICVNCKPEYEDMLRLARENDVSIKALYAKLAPLLEE
ncbi:MAG: hypothetical protein DDT20_01832 [Firmicutes bacterium]|nr:hypothetical protein [Bacillota bacterium]